MLGSLLSAIILLYIWRRLADVALHGGVKVKGVVRPTGWAIRDDNKKKDRHSALRAAEEAGDLRSEVKETGDPPGCVEMVAIIVRWTSCSMWDSDNTTCWVSTLDR